MEGHLTIRFEEKLLRYALPREKSLVGTAENCEFKILSPGVRRQHCELRWDARSATWSLKAHDRDAAQATRINGRRIKGEHYLQDRDRIQIGDAELSFSLEPEAPLLLGEAVDEIALPARGESIEFGRASSDSPSANKVQLDADDPSISRRHLSVECEDGPTYVATDHSASGSLLNGQRFSSRRLVIGDRFRIGAYSFEFTGVAIRRLENSVGASLRGVALTVVVGDNRTILDDVSIDIERCAFAGILGGSGQGKSTLLNVLSGLQAPSSGQVEINGISPASPTAARRIGIGFVPQDDIVHRELTAEQALIYSARLRLGTHLPKRAVRELATETMERLGLLEHRHTRIGDLSGGQRKRVSIATELLSKPAVLFLDEPSSGLDPATEFALMSLLRRLAANDCTVVATTHVLGRAYLFDTLTFVQQGRIVFQGPPGEAERRFEVNSLDEIYLKLSDSETEGSGWERSVLGGEDRPPPAAWDEGDRFTSSPRKSPGFIGSIATLAMRQFRILGSDRLNLLFLLAQAIVVGFLIGWLSANPVLQTFLAGITTLWFGCSNGAQQLVGERPIFRRERLSGLGKHAYLLSKFGCLGLITAGQAALLMISLLITSHLFHPNESSLVIEEGASHSKFDEAFFAYRPTWLEPPPSTANPPPSAQAADQSPLSASETFSLEEASADSAFEVVDAPGLSEPDGGAPSTQPQAPPGVAYYHPTGFRAWDPHYRLLATTAWLFRIEENVLSRLGARMVPATDAKADLEGDRSWVRFVAVLLGLKVIALLSAAAVGVSLGLFISALVRTPTQAVMWVPLILIPQILFGAFVLTSPEMSGGVRQFSRALPSFNVQRIMDVASVHGLEIPRITNKSRVPAFLASPPFEEETVMWTDEEGSHQVNYDKLSPVNKAWQNLVVNTRTLGARPKAFDRDSVVSRRDVRFDKGTPYLELSPAYGSLLILGCWIGGAYLLIALALERRIGRE